MDLFEPLETRRMFAAIVGNELQIIGGPGEDEVYVNQYSGTSIKVKHNGVVEYFNDFTVESILIDLKGGDDDVHVLNEPYSPLKEPCTINCGDGDDWVIAGEGHDLVSGGAGNDTLLGAGGNDDIDGGTGDNELLGGDGNDSLTAGMGADLFNGGSGIDSVDYSSRTAGVGVSLDDAANDGQLIFVPTSWLPLIYFEGDNVRESVENVTSGSGNDTITAGVLGVKNVFDAGGGHDQLDGRAGSDVLLGGDGDDVVLGGDGADTIHGHGGNDNLSGEGWGDKPFGGDGNDVLDGGAGADELHGDDGNDILFAADGAADTLIDGGPGQDAADLDPSDPVPVSCEVLT